MASTPFTRSVRSATENRLKNWTGSAISRSHSPVCILVSIRPCSRSSAAERDSRKPVVAKTTSSSSRDAASTGPVWPTGTRVPRMEPVAIGRASDSRPATRLKINSRIRSRPLSCRPNRSSPRTFSEPGGIGRYST